MSRLPSWPYKDVVSALEHTGYSVVRQKGSHIRMMYDKKYSVTIPAHNPVARGTLRKILRDADLSVEEFIDLL